MTLVKVAINGVYGCTQLLDKHIHFQAWVKEASDNDVFFFPSTVFV